MRNPAGKHLLRVASRAVGSPLGTAAAATNAATPVPAASSGRPLARAGSRSLRATSPPPPSAVAAAECWECRTLRRDGEEDWEEVLASGEEESLDAGEEAVDEYRLVFGSPPTTDEVHAAVSSIQQMFENHFTVDSETLEERQAALLSISGHSSSDISTGSDDWIEPAAHVLNSTSLLTREHRNVLHALRLLQVDPSVQKMVVALSSDKAVWDAVMNNETVQEFRRSFHDGEEKLKGNPTGSVGVLQCILGNAQSKIMEFLEKIAKLVTMLFHPQDHEEKTDLYNDAVRMSFMLSVIVFIVVAVARINCEPEWNLRAW